MQKFLRGSSQHSSHQIRGRQEPVIRGARLWVRSQRQVLKYAWNETKVVRIGNPRPL